MNRLRILGEKITGFLRQIGFLSSPRQFVLTLGDEGATLVSFLRREVVDAIFVAAESEDGIESLRAVLAADPWAELMVSADFLEQVYREEQVPRVSRWDRLTIIRRRLDVAFPHDRLRAAFALGRGRDAAEKIQFAALPVTKALESWIAFLETLPNPVIGFCLLPLDSEGLAAKLAPPPREGTENKIWHALVSQQVTSGFRQIFETDGHMVVTRLTQRPPGDLTAEATALLIERELRSSISYIKRLGYSDGDCLDLVVLANNDVCRAVAERDLPIASLTVMTPRTAGERLGLGSLGPEDSPFADILHAANLLSQKRPRTLLATEAMKTRLRVEQAFKIGFFIASMIVLVTFYYLGTVILDAYDTLTTAEALQNSVAMERRTQAGLMEKLGKYDIPYDEVSAIAETDQMLRAAEIRPGDLIALVASVLEDNVRVRKIQFTAKPSPALQKPAPAPRGAPKSADAADQMQITLQFMGDTASQSDQSIAEARRYKDRLAAALPNYQVTLTKLPFSAQATVVSGSIVIGKDAPDPVASAAAAPAATADYLIKRKA